jgi:vacuolar-type H+-ATPase subunit I/STV1
MTLRLFHLFFIALSIILAAFCGAWAVEQYRATPNLVFVVTAVGSAAGAIGLVAYAAAFQRKTRNL